MKYLQKKLLLKSFSKFWIYLGVIPVVPDLISFYFPSFNIPEFINWKLSVGLLIILYIISYVVEFNKSKKQEDNNKIITLLKEKEKLSQDLNAKEKAIFEERIKSKEWGVVINSLKNKSLSKENIIKKYTSDLSVILFQFGNQKIKNKKVSFISEELEKKYNAKSLGGSLKLIPPKNVPKHVKNGSDLKKWFDKNIQSKYKDSSCVISALGIIDLKNVYWKTDYPYKVRYYDTIGNVLGLDDIFESNEISKILSKENISVVEPVLDGDIAFLCSTFLSDKEMKIIYDNQIKIEKEEYRKEEYRNNR